LSALDLDRLGAIRIAPPGPRPAGAPAPASIDDLLARSAKGAQVRGFTRRGGWSDEAIDLAALGLVDANLKITFASLTSATFKTGAGAVATTLRNQAARITIDDLQLYEGRARGVITLDGANRGQAVIGANLTADGVSALPMLKDLAGFDWLAGKARVAVAVAGQGASERQIVSTLAGKAEIAMADGALVGLNIPQMLRGLSQGRLGSFDRVPTEKTDFSELAASVQIAAGLAQTQDLRLASPLLRLTGAGSVNLPARTLDMTLRPKVVASTAGQGGGINLAGLEVPVRVTGSFDKPSIAPDVGGVLKNPTQIIDAAKQMDRKEVEGTVKGLLSGDPGAKQKARDALKSLLKR
jgi:AsmA protein